MAGPWLRALTRNRAETALDATDPRLRGRTYAVPFERVWQASLGLIARRRAWRLLEADDLEGVIRAEARTLLGFVHDVRISIRLDADAQTRVDLVSASRRGMADLGRNARRIGRFLRRLDRELARPTPVSPARRTAGESAKAARPGAGA